MREECSLLLNGADHNDAKIGILFCTFLCCQLPTKSFEPVCNILCHIKNKTKHFLAALIVCIKL